VDTSATTTTKMKLSKLRAKPKSIGIRALKHVCWAMRSLPTDW